MDELTAGIEKLEIIAASTSRTLNDLQKQGWHPSKCTVAPAKRPTLQLDEPQIPECLSRALLPSQTRSALSAVFVNRTTQLRDVFLREFEDIMDSLIGSNYSKFTQLAIAYEKRYLLEMQLLSDALRDAIESFSIETKSPAKRKSPEHRFPGHVRDTLEEAFEKNPCPSTTDKRIIAEKCGLTSKQVQTWFANARAKRGVKSTDDGQRPAKMARVEEEDIYLTPDNLSSSAASDGRASPVPSLSSSVSTSLSSGSLLDSPELLSLDPSFLSMPSYGTHTITDIPLITPTLSFDFRGITPSIDFGRILSSLDHDQENTIPLESPRDEVENMLEHFLQAEAWEGNP